MEERLININYHLEVLRDYGEPARVKIGSGLEEMLVDQCELLEREIVEKDVLDEKIFF